MNAGVPAKNTRRLRRYEKKLNPLIKVKNLPYAPKPTLPVHTQTHSEAISAEHCIRVRTHRDPRIRQANSKGGRPRVWTEDKLVKLVRLWKEGLSLDEIAREIGMSYNSVKDRVYRMTKEGSLKKRVRKISDTDKDEIVRLIGKGLTQQQVAEVMGISRSAVQGVLRRYNK